MTGAADMDIAFVKVDNRRAAHQLEPGTVAEALNLAFEQGQARTRPGVNLQEWGTLHRNLVTGVWDDDDGHVVSGLVAGKRYVYQAGNSARLTSAYDATPEGEWSAAGVEIGPGTFTATQTTYYLWWPSYSVAGKEVTAVVRRIETPCGYGRFNDPNGVDNAVLLTDDIRDGEGEDGGRGRAWRIQPGVVPQEIPLNGHDVWGTARLVQCFNGLVCLRHGNERHYFTASAVDTTAATIQLNCVPAIKTGDAVKVQRDDADGAFYGGPQLNAIYYANVNTSTKKVKLYDYAASAILGGSGGKIPMPQVEGRFYLELANEPARATGNGAPPLLLQSSPTQSVYVVGWAAVATNISVTGVSSNLLTAPNHRLIPGDEVVPAGITFSGSPTGYFAAPQSDHTLFLYDSVEEALADDGSTGLLAISGVSSATLVKSGASGLPMPPGREGVYYKQRLVIVNGRNNIYISDPLDPLHYALYAGINANLGEADQTNALIPLGDDTLLVCKENTVLAFTGLSGAYTGWALQEITREYGAQAPLAAGQFGSDAWFLARRGIASIAQTAYGKQQGVALPASNDIAKRFQSVDWRRAGQSCSAVWNNRHYTAVPLKGQTGVVKNNAVLVYNALNQGWEDLWQGDALTPVAFARLTIMGEERLTFVNADGLVCWFGDGFEDYTGAIASRLVTRGYFAGHRVLAFRAETDWDTFRCAATVKVRASGYNEEYTAGTFTPDRTKYALDGLADYDPTTGTRAQFRQPGRQDYTMNAREILFAAPAAHQSSTQPWRFRLRDRAPQLVIENSAGSLRLNAVRINAKPIETKATIET